MSLNNDSKKGNNDNENENRKIKSKSDKMNEIKKELFNKNGSIQLKWLDFENKNNRDCTFKRNDNLKFNDIKQSHIKRKNKFIKVIKSHQKWFENKQTQKNERLILKSNK